MSRKELHIGKYIIKNASNKTLRAWLIVLANPISQKEQDYTDKINQELVNRL